MDKSIAPKTQLTVMPENRTNARSAYYNSQKEIRITPRTPFSVHLHEMGHWIESSNPEVEKLCREFLYYRTKGEKPKLLKDITGIKQYGNDEYALKDKFPNPYCGKIYPTGSEILSMGIEMLAEDPYDFYNNDPEYFGLIVSILRGDFSKTKENSKSIR